MKVFLRVWREMEIEEVKKNLLIIGELSGECFNCHNIGINVNEKRCPRCQVKFKYIAFRRKVGPSVLKRFVNNFPQIKFIDYDDFKKAVGEEKAKRILDI